MKKPIIGITLDNEDPGGYSKFPWYAIRQNYLDSVKHFNAIPFPLFHNIKDIDEMSSFLDGIIITGGNFDINPQIYGEKSQGARKTKHNRTNFELNLCKKFISLNKPILGICGGEQLLNIACGGTLIQDIKKKELQTIEHEQLNPRNETSHKVNIEKNSKLKDIIKKNIIKVNSAHHQAINRVGENILISGLAPDGIIESIEHTQHKWCIGVQWHPEFLITSEDKLLLQNFIKVSKKK